MKISKIASFILRTMLKIVPNIAKPIIVGVPVIIQNSKKEILLGKRNKNSCFYPNSWGIPGGLTIQGEKLKDAAIREVKEELDVDIKLIRQSELTHENLPSKDNPIHSLNVLFYAKITKGIPKPKDETREVKWFSPKEIKKLNLAYNHKQILKDEGLI